MGPSARASDASRQDPPPASESPSQGSLGESPPPFRALRASDLSSFGLDSWNDSREKEPPGPAAPAPTRALANGSPSPEVALPPVGSTYLGFDLVAELGRGTFGRVYLARQGELADRFVALKVSTETYAESQKLARLQHTHIMPVYSVHHDGLLQAACMPFLGTATLADVLFDLGQRHELPNSGKGLVRTLRDRQGRTNAALASVRSCHSAKGGADSGSCSASLEGPELPVNLRLLAGLTYVEAVLWLGSKLADGLAHAHERGIVHRDLKPANVLLTDDGLPMLLDFNLSRESRHTPPVGQESTGGTLPYMSPEHLAAFAGLASPVGSTLPEVDARSDLYALGIILSELLTARHPFTRFQGKPAVIVPPMIQERLTPPPPLQPWNPTVSPAVEAIVRRCLEPDPDWRYQSARELKEDLERQFAHLPLRHTPEPCLDERLRKWVRRHPRATSSTSVALVCGLLLLVLLSALVSRSQRLAGVEAIRTLDAFRAEAHTARLHLAGRPADEGLRREGVETARRALHRYSALEDDWTCSPSWRHLPAQERGRLAALMGELLLLLAGTEERPERALDLNERAECVFFSVGPAPRALWAQRAELCTRLGRTDLARGWQQRAEETAVRDAGDSYLLARERAARGRHAEAIRDLQHALAEDPQHFAAWFLLGNCCLDGGGEGRGREREAVAHYTACVALQPAFHGSWFNRGLAHLRQRDYAAAESDFSRALELRPTLVEGRLLRALAHEGAGKDRAALDDLDVVLKADQPPTRAFFLRERVRRRLGDARGASQDREEGLKRTPRDEEGYIARGVARLSNDPRGALEDFTRAAQINPRSQAGLHNQAHVLSERLGKTREAVAVLDRVLELHPDLVPAWAGRAVLKARLGQRAAAHVDARAALARAGQLRDGEVWFQAGCVFALTARSEPADRTEALRLLACALRAGFGHDLIETDPDLDALRGEPAFRSLLEAARTLQRRSVTPPGQAASGG